MERGDKGQQPVGKQAIAAVCESRLRAKGVKVVGHPDFGRVDLVAYKEDVGTVLVEVEGDTSRQKEQAMYSALGQIVLSMSNPSSKITCALAVPDDLKWEIQMRKVPDEIKRLLRLQLWLVSETGVRGV